MYLAGGISSEGISLVYGEAETGKTTMATQCAANCARKGYKTLFVDCDGAFSVQRLSQITSRQFKEIAELIVLMKPETFQAQTTVVDGLAEYITSNLGLIVFDTINSLYRLRIAELPSKTFELNRELNRQLAVLAQTARTRKIAVLTTSQVHSVMNEIPLSVEPVATRVLKFWADTVIALKPSENPKVIRMTLEKNPQRLPSKEYDLSIDEIGLRECSTR